MWDGGTLHFSALKEWSLIQFSEDYKDAGLFTDVPCSSSFSL